MVSIFASIMVLRDSGDVCLPFGECEVRDGVTFESRSRFGVPCAAVLLADGTARVLVRRLGVPSLEMFWEPGSGLIALLVMFSRMLGISIGVFNSSSYKSFLGVMSL